MCFSKSKYAQVLTIYLFDDNFQFCFILGMVFHFSAKTRKKTKFRWKVKTWGNLGHGLFIVIYNTHACHTFGRRPWGAGLPLRITVPSEFQKVWWRQGPMIRGKYFLLLPQKKAISHNKLTQLKAEQISKTLILEW